MAEMKKTARGVLQEALRDAQSPAVYERWWATATSAAAGMDDEVATEMFRRLAIALDIMIDMRGWPARLVRGVNA